MIINYNDDDNDIDDIIKNINDSDDNQVGPEGRGRRGPRPSRLIFSNIDSDDVGKISIVIL